ncbi:MAG: arginase family protein [Candidatus Nanopelagicales bacterium]
MAEDPHWPRAANWLSDSGLADFGLLGVPAHLTSISPTRADTTPDAVREALAPLLHLRQRLRSCEVSAVDLGNIADPDSPAGEDRTRAAVAGFAGRLLVALGGDNSITTAVAQGAAATGLITLDAHHDLRDGASNGSPVRRLIEGGLPGERVVQIGIADFANSAYYAARARDYGITVITRQEVAVRGIADVMAEALEIAGPRVHVDLDVDVCDRSVVPACPASAPGGLSAYELRQAARLAGAAPGVVSMDLTEVDAAADAPDGRTVRLVALCVLEAAAGLMSR